VTVEKSLEQRAVDAVTDCGNSLHVAITDDLYNYLHQDSYHVFASVDLSLGLLKILQIKLHEFFGTGWPWDRNKSYRFGVI